MKLLQRQGLLIFILFLCATVFGLAIMTTPAKHSAPDGKNQIQTPKLYKGKIAFIHNENVLVAMPDGAVHSVTNDAQNTQTTTSSVVIRYRLPIWSPDGTKLAFSQEAQFGTSGNMSYKHSLFVSDGKSIITDGNPLNDFTKLPFWIDSSHILSMYPGIYDDRAGAWSTFAATTKFRGSTWEYVGGDPRIDGLVQPDGCGGGGRPAWLNQLSENHSGGMDGIRSTFVFLSSGELIYSAGCEQESVYVAESNTKSTSAPFDPIRLGDQSQPWNMRKTPQELQLSPDGTLLVGRLGQDIVLYTIDGNLIRQLTQDASAYGPVFSRDGKTVYFADGFGGKPLLKSIAIDGEEERTMYASPLIGAISNISISPNGTEILFTRIDQVTPQSGDSTDPGSVKQSLYIISTEGGDAHLFLENASQGVWGK